MIKTKRLLHIFEWICYTTVVGACVGGIYIWTRPLAVELTPESVSTSSTESIPKVDIKFPDDYSAYEVKFKSRDLFFSETPPEPAANNGQPALSLDGFPANIRVVAILLGKPAQVVLEDTSINKTYFVTEGKDNDGIGLSRLDKNTVVVNYHGQNVPVALKNPGR
ncbi:MAG: hypothetical protein HQL22_01235 [Candidatus Omnitrophica bacterium]|nr:hypothetical protein [Candidatus Omnitrophota bacterium]